MTLDAPTEAKRNNDESAVISPLFSSEGEDDGEWFRDKVRAVFEHFDTDKDDHLKFAELSALQKATAGTMLTEDMYVMACRALDCHPSTGISLDALKLTYAAEGSDIEADYYKIFPDRDPRRKNEASSGSLHSKETAHGDDKVYEIGADGVVDISS